MQSANKVFLPHGQGPGEFSSQIHQAGYGETSQATGGWELGVPTYGDIIGGGRVGGYGIICPEEAEYGLAIHRDAADYGSLQGDGEEVWGIDQ